jgi:hypothetical protein
MREIRVEFVIGAFIGVYLQMHCYHRYKNAIGGKTRGSVKISIFPPPGLHFVTGIVSPSLTLENKTR